MKRPLSGLRAWMVQRFTAVYMLMALLLALFHFAFYPPHSFEAWRSWITGSFVLVAAMLVFFALLLHAWVGLRDVMMDYVKPLPVRVALLALLGFFLAGLAIWVAGILSLARP